MARKIGIIAMCAFLCFTLGAFAGGGTETAKVKLAFWNMPFVTQEVSPEYVLKWENDVVAAIPNATVEPVVRTYSMIRQSATSSQRYLTCRSSRPYCVLMF